MNDHNQAEHPHEPNAQASQSTALHQEIIQRYEKRIAVMQERLDACAEALHDTESHKRQCLRVVAFNGAIELYVAHPEWPSDKFYQLCDDNLAWLGRHEDVKKEVPTQDSLQQHSLGSEA